MKNTKLLYKGFDPSDEEMKNFDPDDPIYSIFIEAMMKKLKLRSYEEGEFLCHRGEEGKEMYLIVQGNKRISRPSGNILGR